MIGVVRMICHLMVQMTSQYIMDGLKTKQVRFKRKRRQTAHYQPLRIHDVMHSVIRPGTV